MKRRKRIARVLDRLFGRVVADTVQPHAFSRLCSVNRLRASLSERYLPASMNASICVLPCETHLHYCTARPARLASAGYFSRTADTASGRTRWIRVFRHMPNKSNASISQVGVFKPPNASGAFLRSARKKQPPHRNGRPAVLCAFTGSFHPPAGIAPQPCARRLFPAGSRGHSPARRRASRL